MFSNTEAERAFTIKIYFDDSDIEPAKEAL